MRYYLCERVGSGTEADPHRPAGVDGVAYTSLDFGTLRFVATEASLATNTKAVLDCGTDATAAVPPGIITKIESTYGIDITSSTLRDILAELLITHAAPGRWPALKAGPDGRYRIYLGGEVWSMAAVAGGASTSDDFVGADGASLGPNWVDYMNPVQILGNRAAGVTVNAHWRSRNTTIFDTADMYAEVEAYTTSTDRAGVTVRNDGTGNNEYQFYFQGNPLWRLTKMFAGVFTVLAETAAPAGLAGDIIRLEANGSTLTATHNGVAPFPAVTDTSLTGPNYVGIYGYKANQGEVDNFRAADLTHVGATPGVGLPTLRPVADGTATTMAAPIGAATYWDAVNDDPHAHDGDATYITPGLDSGGTLFLRLADTPDDFYSMDSLSADIAVRLNGTASDDTTVLYAQVFAANGTTALTNEVTVADRTVGSAYVVRSAAFTTVTAADKATWDGAQLRLRWIFSKSGKSDGIALRVTALELNGAYSAVSSGPPEHLGDAALNAAAMLSAGGDRATTAAASLGSAAALSASGVRGATGAASLVAPAALAAGATVSVPVTEHLGAASLAAPAAFVAAGDVEVPPAPRVHELIVDDFSSRNAEIWDWVNKTDDPASAVYLDGDHLRIDPRITNYSGLYANASHRGALLDSHFSFRVREVMTGGGTGEGFVAFSRTVDTLNNRVHALFTSSGKVFTRVDEGGVRVFDANVLYDPAVHPYLRFSVGALGGDVVFERSADGLVWEEISRYVGGAKAWMDADGQIGFQAGFWDTTQQGQGVFRFDDANVVPAGVVVRPGATSAYHASGTTFTVPNSHGGQVGDTLILALGRQYGATPDQAGWIEDVRHDRTTYSGVTVFRRTVEATDPANWTFTSANIRPAVTTLFAVNRRLLPTGQPLVRNNGSTTTNAVLAHTIPAGDMGLNISSVAVSEDYTGTPATYAPVVGSAFGANALAGVGVAFGGNAGLSVPSTDAWSWTTSGNSCNATQLYDVVPVGEAGTTTGAGLFAAPASLTATADVAAPTIEVAAAASLAAPAAFGAAGDRTTTASASLVAPAAFGAAVDRISAAAAQFNAEPRFLLGPKVITPTQTAAATLNAPAALVGTAEVTTPTVTAAASLAAPAALAAAGLRTTSAAASLSAPATLAAAGDVGTPTVSAGATLTAPAFLAAAGTRTTTASSSLLAPAALVAAASRTTTAAANLTAPAALAAAAGVTTPTVTAAANLTAPAVLAAAAGVTTPTVTAAASLTAPATLSTAAIVTTSATAGLHAPAALTSEAQLLQLAQAHLAAPAKMVGSAIAIEPIRLTFSAPARFRFALPAQVHGDGATFTLSSTEIGTAGLTSLTVGRATPAAAPVATASMAASTSGTATLTLSDTARADLAAAAGGTATTEAVPTGVATLVSSPTAVAT